MRLLERGGCAKPRKNFASGGCGVGGEEKMRDETDAGGAVLG